MMLARSLWRAAALVLFLALSIGIRSSQALAQSNDLETLRQQIQQLDQAGKYPEALGLERGRAAEIEEAETASAGKPGARTAAALNNVAWYALLSRDFSEALAATERAHALDPSDLAVETNRAHALLLLGRVGDARALYRRHKGKPMSLSSNALWEDVIADDIEAFAKAGVRNAAFESINAELGGKSSAATADVAQLNLKVQQLNRAGNYQEAEATARKYVALARARYSEGHPRFATALAWLAVILKNQNRYADAEPQYQRALAIDEKALGPDHANVAADLNNLAQLYQAEGRVAEAEPLFKRALAIVEKVLGPDHPNVGTCLSNLADLYLAQGRRAEAVPLMQRAIAIAEKTLGPDHPDVGKRLNDLAQVYHALGRFIEAEPLFKRTLAITEKARGSDHPDVGAILNNLAELYQSEGHYADAEPLFKRALAIQEKALGPDHPDVGTDLNNLAELYQLQGRHAEAEQLLKRALGITEKALGSDHQSVSIRLNNLAYLYQTEGRYAEAEPLFKRSLAIVEKALGPDHPDVGLRISNLAALYKARGRYAEAEPLFKRALAISEKALGPDHPDVGTDLNNLGQLYQDEGRYAEAEPLYKRMIAIDERALGPDHPLVATGLNNLGNLYSHQGRYAEAEAMYKRAIEIDKKALGPDHPDVGTDLSNLALLYRDEGRYADAEPLLKQMIAIDEKAIGADRPHLGSGLNNLAALYSDQGRYGEAEPLYKRALAIDEKALGPDHSDVGNDVNNLASLYLDQGRFTDAEPLMQRALAIKEKAFGPDHPDVGAALDNLAAIYFAQGEWERAADYWRKGTSVIINRTRRGTLVGEATTGKRKSEAAQNSLQFMALVKAVQRLASKQPDEGTSLREMFQTAQWAQSSEAAESLSQMAARGAKGDSKLAALVRERQDLVAEWQNRDQLRSAAVAQAPDKRNADAEAENIARIAAIDARLTAIDKDLAANFPDYAALASPAPLPVEEVQAQLGADEALVLFLDTPEIRQAPEETFVWVVTKTDVRWIRSELGTESLTREVAALRCGLDYNGSWTDQHCADLLKVDYTRADHDFFGKPLPFDLARAHALYEALFGQIKDQIKDKRLLIVPSGPLTQLPFQVLVTEPPKAAIPTSVADYRNVAWLAREHAITILPAVSSLKALRELAKESHASEPYIGFGDPLLDGDPINVKEDAAAAKLAREKHCDPTLRDRVASVLGWRGGNRAVSRNGGGGVDVADLRTLPPLPETADEVCDVARELGVDPVKRVFLGAAATETKIKELSASGTLAKNRIVHFATHGAIAGDLSGTSEPGLILTPPDKGTETDDGYLNASEVAGLKLDADWVILSACNTAAGDAKGAEALSGLARAFFYAGARSLLVSHWEVASEATVKLITKAVDELKRDPKIGRAEALRRSMLAMIDTGNDNEAHPAFWAPFVLVGEGGATR
jgi:tetratricopeptide (TPR) repeat protein/CHAT domain-containing protein